MLWPHVEVCTRFFIYLRHVVEFFLFVLPCVATLQGGWAGLGGGHNNVTADYKTEARHTSGIITSLWTRNHRYVRHVADVYLCLAKDLPCFSGGCNNVSDNSDALFGGSCANQILVLQAPTQT